MSWLLTSIDCERVKNVHWTVGMPLMSQRLVLLDFVWIIGYDVVLYFFFYEESFCIGLWYTCTIQPLVFRIRAFLNLVIVNWNKYHSIMTSSF